MRVSFKLLFAAGFGAALASTASAADVADFYKGRELDVVIGSTPGGGFDTYGRFLSRHMYRHIPGNPVMVPKNMPGAGGLKQRTYMTSAAPKDGSVIAIINPVMTTAPLLTPDVAKFDPLKYEWIGSANAEISTCGFWSKSGVSALEDLSKRELVIGGVGPSSGSTLDAITLKNVLGLPFKVVAGYSGLSEVALAGQRGEVDGACGLNVTTLKSAHWDAVKNGELKIILQTSLRNHPELPGVVNAFSLAKTEEQKQIMQMTFGPWIYGRPFVAPPGTDKDRLAALRAAFQATMKDPLFLADAEKARLEVNPSEPAEILALIKEIYATPPAVIEKTRMMLSGGGKI